MRFFIIFLSLLCIQNFAKARECAKKIKEVDLRSDFGPIRNQGEIGWCYAFGTADMLSFYIKKVGNKYLHPPIEGNLVDSKNLVSPVGVAHIFNKEQNADHYEKRKLLKASELKDIKVFAEGGDGEFAFELSRIYGVCLESEAPSEDFSQTSKGRSLEELLNALNDNAPESAQEFNPNYCNLYQIAKDSYPKIPEKELDQIIASSSRKDIFTNLTLKACKHEFIFPKGANKPELDFITTEDDGLKTTMKTLDEALDKGWPSVIGYNANILVKSSLDSTVKEDDEDEDDGDKDAAHASMVVGRRLNPVTCQEEYILRNSWGPSCDTYRKKDPRFKTCLKIFDKASAQKSITKDEAEILKNPKASPQFLADYFCEKKYPPLPRNKKVSCDDKTGYVFIEKSQIKKAISDVMTFKKI